MGTRWSACPSGVSGLRCSGLDVHVDFVCTGGSRFAAVARGEEQLPLGGAGDPERLSQPLLGLGRSVVPRGTRGLRVEEPRQSSLLLEAGPVGLKDGPRSVVVGPATGPLDSSFDRLPAELSYLFPLVGLRAHPQESDELSQGEPLDGQGHQDARKRRQDQGCGAIAECSAPGQATNGAARVTLVSAMSCSPRNRPWPTAPTHRVSRLVLAGQLRVGAGIRPALRPGARRLRHPEADTQGLSGLVREEPLTVKPAPCEDSPI
jgi:hypothetical protein